MKQLIFKSLSLCAILTVVLSCQRVDILPKAEIITVDMESAHPVNEEEYFKSTDFIALETNENSLIGSIDKIMFTDDFFAVADTRQSCIILFDYNGKHIRTIKRLGRGPQEYVQFTGATLDLENKQFVVYDDQRSRFLVYSYEGEWKATIPYKMLLADSYMVRDGYLYVVNADTMTEEEYLVSKVKLSGDYEITPIADFTMPDKTYHQAHGEKIGSYGKKVLVSERFNNTIYEVKNDKLVPRYTFDFGAQNIEKLAKELNDEQLEEAITDKEKGYVYGITNMLETDDYLFFNTNHAGFVALDKKSGVARAHQTIRVSQCPLSSSSSIALENAGDRYVSSLRALLVATYMSRYKEYLQEKGDAAEKQELREDFARIASNIAFDDNPVLLIHHIK